jgi:hypothetical protein
MQGSAMLSASVSSIGAALDSGGGNKRRISKNVRAFRPTGCAIEAARSFDGSRKPLHLARCSMAA